MKPPADPGVAGCRWMAVRGATDSRGSVSFVETGTDLDFPVRRAFWIHSVQPGQPRGHHAHRDARLLMVAVAGAADLILDDGVRRETVRLDRPDRGMFLEPWVWHELADIAAGTVVLVLASTNYAESDYIRGYDDFLREAKARRK
ncbi:MAG: FdtA/QdtA family cupin domain-containing protein [Rhodospirillales bacterium]|nr:MAG: FdtA/QdtA family cupin domain-containing protein [Rhodospirillales bacterium]